MTVEEMWQLDSEEKVAAAIKHIEGLMNMVGNLRTSLNDTIYAAMPGHFALTSESTASDIANCTVMLARLTYIRNSLLGALHELRGRSL